MNEYFREIKSLCKKHGLSIGDKTIYTQKLFGKSGVYSTIYEPLYLCDSEPWSKRVLQDIGHQIEIALSKGKNVSLSLLTDDDIDVRSSIINLTECYGRRTVRIVVNYC